MQSARQHDPRGRVGDDGDVERLAASMRAQGLAGCELALVLGSGLGAFGERLADARSVPFDALDGMPGSAVPGHAGRFLHGTIGGARVLLQQGRAHLYEGWSPEQVTRSVRAFAALGCRALVLTNAAGGLRREWEPGSLMRLTDHINLQGRAPLRAAERAAACAYDARAGAELDRAAQEAGVRLERGVYAALLGPSYETPAEIRMLGALGADAVGMSTVAEAAVGHAVGLRVAAISCITNHAAGISGEPLSHSEVVETGKQASARFARLLERALPALARAAALVLLLCFGLAACRSTPPADFDRLELYFGLTGPGGAPIGAAEWERFEVEVLVPELGGFSVIEARGAWTDPEHGRVAREPSRAVVHYFDPREVAALRAKAARVVDEYKRRFEQKSVLVGWLLGTHEFQ
ncbi:MAG: purine-nucleoside phosphorylase [Planctomycetes bacterium]|nr:purine-nucleoside phosphorylase [Planctomycetota bacterium]